MHTRHLTQLLTTGKLLLSIPQSQFNHTEKKFKQQWKSLITLYVVLVIAIFNSIFWSLVFYKKVLEILQVVSGVSFLLTNIISVIWIKKHSWYMFCQHYFELDTTLNDTTIASGNKVFSNIFIYLIIHIYFIASSTAYYLNSPYNNHIFYHILMFLQNYYQLFTGLIIITINMCIKCQYLKINTYLQEVNLHSCSLLPQLQLISDQYRMNKECVNNVTDVFGWQLMILHGQTIINILGFLSEVISARQSPFGVLQLANSVFTVS